MTESVYDGAQTASDIFCGCRHYLRDEYEYEYELKDNSIIIKEKTKAELFPSLAVPYQSKSGMVFMLDDLEDQLQDIDEEGLTSLQYELDMFREDFDDFLTPEKVDWFDRMYDAVSAELDARWLLKKLEERHIVRIERGW